MADWGQSYPIDTEARIDTVKSGFVKVNNEFQLVYNFLNKLRNCRAGTTPPTDANQYELWLDTSVSPPKLKYYNGTNWVDADELIPQGSGSGLDADKVDGYETSLTPAPNVIPITNTNGKLTSSWLVNINETYSRMTVSSSFPASPNHNDLCWRSDELKLYKYDAVSGNWNEIDWQTIVKGAPEWGTGRLRINATTGKLEISPDGTNWYECIPAVGSQVIELNSIDNTSYSYKYWIAPGQTVIIPYANHVPIVYTPAPAPFYEGHTLCLSALSTGSLGLKPSGVAISDGFYQYVAGSGASAISSLTTSLSSVPVSPAGSNSPEKRASFSLRIYSSTNQRFVGNSVGSGTDGTVVLTFTYGGTAPSSSYWLGTWSTSEGTQFTMDKLTLTRRA